MYCLWVFIAGDNFSSVLVGNYQEVTGLFQFFLTKRLPFGFWEVVEFQTLLMDDLPKLKDIKDCVFLDSPLRKSSFSVKAEFDIETLGLCSHGA